MKRTIAVMFISAIAVTGCSRPVHKETVVERPVVVEKAATGSSAPSCTYASQSYSHGSVSCQDRSQFRCDNGIWNRTANAC
ncbi:MAG TPA: hypothetical protein VFU24_16960 [Burkholderiales bacterium]|nr:hypothetical protein [Burkholderiales bacterium]